MVEIVVLPKPKFYRIQRNGAGEVNPSPEIASAAAALDAPPFTTASHRLRRRREMLHQEAGIDRNQDCRGEVAQEAQNLTGGIGIFQRCLLRESTSSRVTHRWDDAR